MNAPIPVQIAVYERATGRIVAVKLTYSPEEDRTAEHDYVPTQVFTHEGVFVDLRQSPPRVVSLPDRPSPDHEFDYGRRVWVLDRARAAARVRAERNTRLLTSDWTQLPDVPEATRHAWSLYRQALRDITTQSGFPERVEWPTPP